MANRRMFSKEITESDSFADLPLSSQALYFHLGMNADDDGFVNNPKKVQRGIGASNDDLSLLVAKGFLIAFESGIVVVKHWRINNYIRGDRKIDTKYADEIALLTVKSNGAYSIAGDDKPILMAQQAVCMDETARQAAYRESSLPASFDYKIRSAFYGEPCPICGVTMIGSVDECGIASEAHKPTIQHNIPISKGGKHELGNISVICHECNVSLRDTPTGKLNAEQVIRVWDGICLSNDGQMSGKRQHSIGKDSIGKDKDTLSGRPDDSSDRNEIVAYLNAAIGASFKATTKKTVQLISARMKEGFTVDDFKAVIDKKSSDWKSDPKMSRYLRPETLFGTKFEGYLQESKAVSPHADWAKYR